MTVKINALELSKKMKVLRQIDLSKNDKLTYSIKKTIQSADDEIEKLNKELKVSEIQNEFNRNVESINIKYTSVAEDGNLYTSEDGKFIFKFTKENLISRNDEVKVIEDAANKKLAEYEEKFKASELSINVHQAELTGEGWERVNDLDIFTKEELKGFLFK
jgi:hypothetical protein